MMNATLRFLPCFVAGIGGFAHGAIIDTFESGSQFLELNDSALWASSTVGIDGSIFETRNLKLQYGRTQQLSVTTDGFLNYRVDEPGPDASGNINGYFSVRYESVHPVNLLSDNATGFRLLFEAASVATESIAFPAHFLVHTPSGKEMYSWNYTLDDIIRDSNGNTFQVDIPFSTFSNLDLSQVSSISFEGFRIAPGAAFRLTSITTVPEPSPLAALVTPLLFLLFSRHRPAMHTAYSPDPPEACISLRSRHLMP